MASEADPYKLTRPHMYLLRIVIFLAIAGFMAAILFPQIRTAFMANPGLNGLIIGVLVIGIVLAIRQVVRLFPEVAWVNDYRLSDPGIAFANPPTLLAPMATLLGDRVADRSISPATMRSILDSIGTRLDESRDILRYIGGLLVFLGLLGTFWGLLQTIGSIGNTIQTLEPSAGDSRDFLDSLKVGLQAPLAGMGTAFSSSLFGLSGSLVLGFLDLQSGRAQNRFYTELENWLSAVTDVSSDSAKPVEIKSGASDEFKALAEQLSQMQGQGVNSPRMTAAMASLADGISGLVKNMRNEQQMLRDWVEAQARDNAAQRETLERIAALLDRNPPKGD